MIRKHVPALILMAVSAGLAVAGALLLPDTVITQLQAGGGVSTMPKWAAVALPTALGVGGGIADLLKKAPSRTPLLISGAGVLLAVVTLVVNLIK